MQQIGNYSTKEILHSGCQKPHSQPCTVKQGYDIAPGQAAGKITASGLWGPYDPAATDGREFCRGIFAEYVNTSSTGLNRDYGPVNVYHGEAVYKTSALVGVDAIALRHLGGIALDNDQTHVGCGKRPTVERPVSGFGFPVTTPTDANYAAKITDSLIVWPSIAAARTQTLPPAASMSGQILFVKAPSNANTNNLTIDPDASEQINGSGTLVVSTANQTLILVSTGTEWRTF